jgi:hypothetical protein
MHTTHDENATTWRDLADQLTPEQASRYERHEADAMQSIAAARNVYESPEDIARCFLSEARVEAAHNLTDSTFDVPVPASTVEVGHWEEDGEGRWTRLVHGESRTIDSYDATFYLTGEQSPDGAVAWSLYVHVNDSGSMTTDQVRELAAKLIEAADELDRLGNRSA